MKKISTNNTAINSIMLISIMIFSGLLLLFSFNLNVIMGIPSEIVKGDYLFGRTIGIAEDENGKPLWIISGNWKTSLSNQTQTTDNNSTVFDASFEMIKTDGTSKHTHTFTNFVLVDIENQNNATVFNGTGTISMPNASINEVPVSIKVMDNNNLNIIYIDPDKVDNHYGIKPIYGIPLEGSGQYENIS